MAYISLETRYRKYALIVTRIWNSPFIITHTQLGHSVLILPYSYLVLLLLNVFSSSGFQENVILLSCS